MWKCEMWQRAEVNGGHSFLPIAAKWLASGTDDDDDDDDDNDDDDDDMCIYL